MSKQASLDPVWPTLRSVATCVVPEAERLDEEGWREVRTVMEDALQSRPAALARRLRVFVRVLHWLPLAIHGRTLVALDSRRRSRLLERVPDSPLGLLRRGFWACARWC